MCNQVLPKIPTIFVSLCLSPFETSVYCSDNYKLISKRIATVRWGVESEHFFTPPLSTFCKFYLKIAQTFTQKRFIVNRCKMLTYVQYLRIKEIYAHRLTMKTVLSHACAQNYCIWSEGKWQVLEKYVEKLIINMTN